MKIGKTKSGTYYARYVGFVAIGKTAGDAYNALVVMFNESTDKKNENNRLVKNKNCYSV